MGSNPTSGTIINSMGMIFTKHIDQDFFKKWNSEMGYLLGYITADGCIVVSKKRKNHPFMLNITSAGLKHLYKLRNALKSEHKISRKPNGGLNTFTYQLQIRNPIITNDLMELGIFPRKTGHLNPIKVPEKYFPDFVRGFFDGDGTVYIYKVNKVSQIKAGFINTSLSFFKEFNKQLCKNLDIPTKSIHKIIDKRGEEKMVQFNVYFYVDDCEKLAEFMYGNNPSLYLPRKRRIFEEWKLIKRRYYIKQNYPSKIGWHLNKKTANHLIELAA